MLEIPRIISKMSMRVTVESLKLKLTALCCRDAVKNVWIPVSAVFKNRVCLACVVSALWQLLRLADLGVHVLLVMAG